MRRSVAAAVLAVAVATVALPALPTAADPGGTSPTLPMLPEQAAERALTVATRVLDGKPSVSDPDATLALRDLRLALPDLRGADRQQAVSILARPTDGASDPNGDGYDPTSQVTRLCSTNDKVCVHYVTTTGDPDQASPTWAQTTLDTLNAVWQQEVVTMGYRAPLRDANRGGNGKLDIYLADVGSKNLYGYCAPERKKYRYTYTGYCVLDNDFAGFPGTPLANLKVTAAHEFFHAVQFAYDAAEDRWLMESTATWMEERYADDVNDNRQYLPYGQLGRPMKSLDSSAGFEKYGNWAFWEYLTEHKGNGLVKQVWNKAGAFKGAPDMFSTQALVRTLKSKGGFAGNFGAYASALTLPAKGWDEGAEWSSPKPFTTTKLRPSHRRAGPVAVKLNHMASKSWRFVPDRLTSSAWRLSISVNGPTGRTSPVAFVAVKKKSGAVSTKRIRLNRNGDGSKLVGFSSEGVNSVLVTLGNASTRFRCWQSQTSPYSCLGKPKDNRQRFAFSVRAKKV
jgi:hypothetical protein